MRIPSEARKAWFLIAAGLAAMYGGSKQTWQPWTFQNGVSDAGSWFDETNGVAYARWTYSPGYGGYAFKWQYAVGTNDAELVWTALPDAVVADGLAVAPVPVAAGDAVRFACWAQYVAPVIVTTNGVYHLGGVSRALGGDAAPADAPLKYVPFAVPVCGLADDGSAATLTPTNAPPAGSLLRAIFNETQENEQ